MGYEVPKEIVRQAEAFWDDEGVPLLREPRTNERVLILGWSIGQELHCLLTKENEGEDYAESASEAENSLPDNLPSQFTCAGETVTSLRRGFYDGNGDEWSEITFAKPWHASLLQCWLDNDGIPICIRPSSAMQDERAISDHVARAGYSFDRTIRYAAFKDMSIRYEIRTYVGAFWSANRELPTGTHTLQNGTTVAFSSPPDPMLPAAEAYEKAMRELCMAASKKENS